MRVLICPLDWGLGHATRCIPLIKAFREAGHQVLIASGGPGRILLEREFPYMTHVEWKGYTIRYTRSPRWLIPVLCLQFPGLLLSMIREHRRLGRLIDELQIDLILSDNRYGLFTRRRPCILMTHQLFIRAPKGYLGLGRATEFILRKVLAFFMSRYTETWVPDFSGDKNLSGQLSHGLGMQENLRFIGPLSRFLPIEDQSPALAGAENKNTKENKNRIEREEGRISFLALVSGVEPQRSMLGAALRLALEDLKGTRLLVLGMPQPRNLANEIGDADYFPKEGVLNVVPHLDGPALEACLRAAQVVIARSGYSTIMELAGLNKRQIILIPTPGQTEQEYLAEYLDRRGVAPRLLQHDLNLPAALGCLEDYSGFSEDSGDNEAAGKRLVEFIRAHPLLAHTSCIS